MAKQFDWPRLASFWRIFSPSISQQSRRANPQISISMTDNPQLAQAAMLSGSGKLYHN